jgi:hypothetical protein
MKQEKSMLEQIEEINSEREILFKEKAKIDSKLLKLHNKKDKLLQTLDNEFISTIPKDINKITAKQWAWILHTDDHSHSMVQYNYRNNLLIKYKISSFGYYPETKQPCITFHEYGFDAEKAKEIIKILQKHLIPITAKGPPSETGVCIQFTGLEPDVTSVSYIHKDKTAIIYVSGSCDYKRFANFNLLVDWVKDHMKKDDY